MSAMVLILMFAAEVGATKPETVPAVTSGPDLDLEAQPTAAPIDGVTVYSDRARVRRKAEVALGAGVHALRLPNLPGATRLDTIRVAASGARVVRVEAAPVEEEQVSIEAVREALRALEVVTDRLLTLDGQLRAYTEELSFLAELAPKAPVAEEHRAGKPLPPLPIESYRVVLDFLGERRATLRARVRGLELERAEQEEQAAQLRRSVALRDLGAFTTRSVRVLAIVELRAPAKVTLALEYFIPGALWRPSYDLRYFAKEQRVEIATYGLVTQATGEPWEDVALELSTAIPGQGIELPELATWTLGEKRELIPTPRPATEIPRPQPFAPPKPSPTQRELARSAELGALAAELAALDAHVARRSADERSDPGEGGKRPAPPPPPPAPPRSIPYAKKTVVDFADDTIEGALAQPEGNYMVPRDREVDARQEAPAPAMMAESESAPSGGSALSSVTRAIGDAFGSEEPSYRHTSLELFDELSTRPAFGDPSLPAVLAGGLDYVYPAASRFTVPAGAERLRAPLAVDRYPVSVYYEATPSLSTTAYLRAAVENKGERPLLAGPVNIFVGDTFTGEGTLATTGPGGKIELPLGADEDLRIVRNVKPATRTEGVFSKDDVTTYTTEIQVGNYKPRAIRIFIVDQVPRSNQEDLEVKLLSATPSPKDPPNADGLMRFELQIPAGETRKITFSYDVARPAGWQLQQY